LAQNSDGIQVHVQQLFPNPVEAITLLAIHVPQICAPSVFGGGDSASLV
jgi:hypothetical protein